MEETNEKLPLHVIHENKLVSTINRAHIFIHSLSLSLLVYHRLSLLLYDQNDVAFPWLVIFLAELTLSFFWISEQAYRWRRIDREVFIEQLPEESQFPAVDVVICTADPNKEPTVEVMNTVISAMALDYPADKLHVYLSDDGGSLVTQMAMKEAWGFATWWLPFCRKYRVRCRCPMAYFDDSLEESSSDGDDFFKDRLQLKEKYEAFKQRVEMNLCNKIGESDMERSNHPPLIQVINKQGTDPSIINPVHVGIPRLIYVAREKRPSHHHHFKAGALNVLLRVSSILSNSPIVLVLDCDMYCNDPTSAKQAMCFYLDQHISPSLAFVQFPQRLRNVTKSDIYDTDFRFFMKLLWHGIDGLNMGPILSGTGFYINRKALYYGCLKGLDIVESRKIFGSSNEFVKTLSQAEIKTNSNEVSQELVREAEFVASSTYEKDTKWGQGVGFFYHSLVEDFTTGYNLHCRGWKSVYLFPQRDAFLGTTPTNLNDVLTQSTRWMTGLLEVGLSRFSPFIYGPSRSGLSLLQRSCYAWLSLHPMMSLSIWCFAIIPQMCLLHGIPLYPKASSMSFLVVAFIFLSSFLKHLYEVLTIGGTILSWWNEWRMWIIKMLTSHTYGTLDAVMSNLRLKKTSFIPTNKIVDNEQGKRYNQDIYDFQTSNMFLVPLGTVVILNFVCFIGGLVRVMLIRNWDEMTAQVILSGYFLVLSKVVIEGMVVRKDKGKFPTYATIMSVVACLGVLVVGYLMLLY